LVIETFDYHDFHVQVYDLQSRLVVDSFDAYSVAVAHNSNELLMVVRHARDSARVHVYDAATLQLKRTIRTGYPSLIALDRAGRFMAVTDGHGIELWDYQTGRQQQVIEPVTSVRAVAFSRNGERLAFSGSANDYMIVDFPTGRISSVRNHRSSVQDLAFSPNDSLLISAAWDSLISVYDIESEKTPWTFRASDHDFGQVTVDYSSQVVVASVGDSAFAYNLSTGEKLWDYTYDQNVSIDRIILSPNGRDMAMLLSGSAVWVWDYSGDSTRFSSTHYSHALATIAYDQSGEILAAGGYGDTVFVWYLFDSSRSYRITVRRSAVRSVAIDSKHNLMALGMENGHVYLVSLAEGDYITSLEGHNDKVIEVAFSDDGLLATGSDDGQIILWDLNRYKRMCSLYAFADGNWAVIDSIGRFDASYGGQLPNLHFVIDGKEVVELSQLKERYYEPGLLQKLLGYDDEPLRDVGKLGEIEMFPRIDSVWIDQGKQLFEARFTERNGGMGKITFYINGMEVVANALTNLRQVGDKQWALQIALSSYTDRLKPNDHNSLSIQAFNKGGYLSSRVVHADYVYKPAKIIEEKPMQFFAVLVGTSTYRGDKLKDLQFADNDAADMGAAVRAAASELFEPENVHVHILSTADSAALPSKENVATAFRDVAAQSSPDDIVLAYFSGHGVTWGGDDAQFYYLTKDIESGDLADPGIRSAYAIAGSEITDWLISTTAEKKVLIVDACASGRLIEDYTALAKSVAASQRRAFERMKDRSATFILSGSAGDAESYEGSAFGQSLLTYSLLLGMSGLALQEEQYVDVSELLQFARDRVPKLAEEIGRTQLPEIAAPYGSESFFIGLVTPQVHIPVSSPKPVFLRSSFQDEDLFDDHLQIGRAFEDRLRDISSKGRRSSLLFSPISERPNSYSVSGRYSVRGEVVTMRAKLFRIDEHKQRLPVGEISFESPSKEPTVIVDILLEKLSALVLE
jgi:WD40 repeat protein